MKNHKINPSYVSTDVPKSGITGIIITFISLFAKIVYNMIQYMNFQCGLELVLI